MRNLYGYACLALAALASACGTNVVAAGRMGAVTDPESGETWYSLEDLETSALELRARGFDAHDGVVVDVWANHEVLRWQGCVSVGVYLDGELASEPKVVRKDFETERGALGNVVYIERATFILYDAELAPLAQASQIELDVCGHTASFQTAPRDSLQRFAATVLATRDGGYIPPAVVPSD